MESTDTTCLKLEQRTRTLSNSQLNSESDSENESNDNRKKFGIPKKSSIDSECNTRKMEWKNKTDDDKLNDDKTAIEFLSNKLATETQQKFECATETEISPRNKLPDLIPDQSAESPLLTMSDNDVSDREYAETPPPLPKSMPPVLIPAETPPPLPLSSPPLLRKGINNDTPEITSKTSSCTDEYGEDDHLLVSADSRDLSYLPNQMQSHCSEGVNNQKKDEREHLLSDYDSDSTMENDSECEASDIVKDRTHSLEEETQIKQSELGHEKQKLSLEDVQVSDITDISSAEETFKSLLAEFRSVDMNDTSMDFDEEFEAIFNSLSSSNSDLDPYHERFAGRRDKYGFILSPIIESPSPTPSSMSGYSGLSSVSPDPFSMFRVSPAPRSGKREMDLSSLRKSVSEWDSKETEQTIPIYQNRLKEDIFIPDGTGWESDNELLTPTSGSEWDSFPSGLSTPPANADVQFGAFLKSLNRPDNIIYEENESSSAECDSDDSDDTLEACETNSVGETSNEFSDFTKMTTSTENETCDSNIKMKDTQRNVRDVFEHDRTEHIKNNNLKSNIDSSADITKESHGNDSGENNRLAKDLSVETNAFQGIDSSENSSQSKNVQLNDGSAICKVSKIQRTSDAVSTDDRLRQTIIKLNCPENKNENSSSGSDSNSDDSDDEYEEGESEREYLSNDSSDERTDIPNSLTNNMNEQNIDYENLKECLNSTAYIFVPTSSVVVSGTMTPDDIDSSNYSDDSADSSPNMSSFGSGIKISQYTSGDSEGSESDTKTKYVNDHQDERAAQVEINEDAEYSEQTVKHDSNDRRFHSPLDFSFIDANATQQPPEESPRSPRVLGRHYLEMNDSERMLCISPPKTRTQHTNTSKENTSPMTNQLDDKTHHRVNLLYTGNEAEDNDETFKFVQFKVQDKQPNVQEKANSSEHYEHISEDSESGSDAEVLNIPIRDDIKMSSETESVHVGIVDNGQTVHSETTAEAIMQQKDSHVAGKVQKRNYSRRKSPVEIKISHLKRNVSARNKVKPGYVKDVSKLFTETCQPYSVDVIKSENKKPNCSASEINNGHIDALFAKDNLVITCETKFISKTSNQEDDITITPFFPGEQDTALENGDEIFTEENIPITHESMYGEANTAIQVSKFPCIETNSEHDPQYFDVCNDDYLGSEICSHKLLQDTLSAPEENPCLMKPDSSITLNNELVSKEQETNEILTADTLNKTDILVEKFPVKTIPAEFSFDRDKFCIELESRNETNTSMLESFPDNCTNTAIFDTCNKIESNEYVNTELLKAADVEPQSSKCFDREVKSGRNESTTNTQKKYLDSENQGDTNFNQTCEDFHSETSSALNRTISEEETVQRSSEVNSAISAAFKEKYQGTSVKTDLTFESDKKHKNKSETFISENDAETNYLLESCEHSTISFNTSSTSFPDCPSANAENQVILNEVVVNNQNPPASVSGDIKWQEYKQNGRIYNENRAHTNLPALSDFFDSSNDSDFGTSIVIQLDKFKSAVPSFFCSERQCVSDSTLDSECSTEHKTFSETYTPLIFDNAETLSVSSTFSVASESQTFSTFEDKTASQQESKHSRDYSCENTEENDSTVLNFDSYLSDNERFDSCGEQSENAIFDEYCLNADLRLPNVEPNIFQHTFYDVKIPIKSKSKLLKKPAGQSDYCIEAKRNTVTANNTNANRSDNILPVAKCSDASCDKCIFDFPGSACHSLNETNFTQVNSGCCNVNSENINVISHKAKGGDRLTSDLTNDCCYRRNEGVYIPRRLTANENTHQKLAMNDGAANSVNTGYDTCSPLAGINGSHLRETQDVFHSRMPRSDTRSSKGGSFVSKDTSDGLKPSDSLTLFQSSVYDRVIEDESGRVKGWPYSDLDNQDRVPVKVYRTFKKLSLEEKGSPKQSTKMRIVQTEERSAEMPDDKTVRKIHSSSVLPSDTSEKQLMKSHAESIQAALQTDANGNTLNEEEIADVLPKLAETVANMKNVNAEEIMPGITQTVAKLKDGGNLVITTMTRKVIEDEEESSSERESQVHPVLDVDDLEKSQIYLVQDSRGDLFYVEDVTSESQESAYYSSSRHTSESVSDSGNSPTFQRISKIKQVGNSGIKDSTAEELISAMYDQNGVTEIDEFEDEYSERTYEFDLPRDGRVQETVPRRDYSKDSFKTSYMVEEPDSASQTAATQGGKTTTKDHYESSYEMTSAQPWLFDGAAGQYGSQVNYSPAMRGSGDELERASTLSENDNAYRMQNVVKTSEATSTGYTTTTEKYSVEAEAYVLPTPETDMTLVAVPPAVYVPPPQPIAAGIQTDEQAQFSLVKVDMTPKNVVEKVETAVKQEVVEEEKERPIYKTVAHIQTKERPRPKPMGVDMTESKKYRIVTTKPTPVEEVQESHMSLDEVDYKMTTENIEYKLTSPSYESKQFYVRNSARAPSPERFRTEKRLELSQGSNERHKTEIQVKDTKDYDTQTYEENSFSYDKVVQNNESTDGNMRVVRGSYLIKNTLDEVDGTLDDNLNMFDGSFTLRKDNPLYQSDEDIYKRFEREKAENARKQERFQRDLNQDITFETVDKFSKSKTGIKFFLFFFSLSVRHCFRLRVFSRRAHTTLKQRQMNRAVLLTV